MFVQWQRFPIFLLFLFIMKTYAFTFFAGLTCWGLVVVLLIRVSKNFSQFLVRHVSQLSQIQEVKVHLQGRHTTQWFYEAERGNRRRWEIKMIHSSLLTVQKKSGTLKRSGGKWDCIYSEHGAPQPIMQRRSWISIVLIIRSIAGSWRAIVKSISTKNIFTLLSTFIYTSLVKLSALHFRNISDTVDFLNLPRSSPL